MKHFLVGLAVWTACNPVNLGAGDEARLQISGPQAISGSNGFLSSVFATCDGVSLKHKCLLQMNAIGAQLQRPGDLQPEISFCQLATSLDPLPVLIVVQTSTDIIVEGRLLDGNDDGLCLGRLITAAAADFQLPVTTAIDAGIADADSVDAGDSDAQ